jgi:hypothetical protein
MHSGGVPCFYKGTGGGFLSTAYSVGRHCEKIHVRLEWTLLMALSHSLDVLVECDDKELEVSQSSQLFSVSDAVANHKSDARARSI